MLSYVLPVLLMTLRFDVMGLISHLTHTHNIYWIMAAVDGDVCCPRLPC